MFRKRFIISLHAVYANIDKNGLSGFATRLILNNAEVILGMSKAVNNQLAQYGIRKNRINEYRYWLDTQNFKPMGMNEARKKLNIEDRFTVLFVGRLITIKGIKLLVEVAKELKHLQFLFVGAGPLEDFLKSSSKQFSNIHFLGKIQNTELPIYYNSADLLCIPSLYEEALGRVTLEAVACGIPVVGSNKGGILEFMTNDISVLVQPTHKDLKETIVRLSENQNELKTLKTNCRPHALKFFSKDSIKLITKHYL
jgi:glycosyltransferase involved in cell wall biosynthesis